MKVNNEKHLTILYWSGIINESPKRRWKRKQKKVKKCLTEMVEHDKLEKSPREADKKSYKKRQKNI